MQRPTTRLSVDIIPDQSFETAREYSPYSHWLFGKDGGYVTRLEDDVQDAHNDNLMFSDAEAVVAQEVADWLESQECDEFWMSRTRQPQSKLPNTAQLLSQLKSSDSLRATSSGDRAKFEALLHLIALQLLATSYTLSPTSSSNHIPLFQQRKEPSLTTALRASSRHRFSPAAGHHARPPSETNAWPGLYTGPSIEERLADHISEKRRRKKHCGDYTPSFAGSGWTDGPPPTATREDSRSLFSRASSSSSSEPVPGFFSKLICQAAIPKNYRRKYNTMFLSRMSSKPKRRKPSQDEEKHHCHDEQQPSQQDVSSQPVQRIPSVYRLRHTQSAPRIEVEDGTPVNSLQDSKRYGSDPSIGSPLDYPFQIPELRRTSVTPSGSWCPGSSVAGSMRACGRGDLIVAQDYFDEIPETAYTVHHQQSQWKIPHWRQKHAWPLSPPETTTPPKSTATSHLTSASDYFGQVCSEKHNTRQKDDHDVAAREHSDAGPETDEDVRLKEILGSTAAPHFEDGSSDSDMERTKKRKGINESQATACEVAERFRDKTGDGIDNLSAKVVW